MTGTKTRCLPNIHERPAGLNWTHLANFCAGRRDQRQDREAASADLAAIHSLCLIAFENQVAWALELAKRPGVQMNMELARMYSASYPSMLRVYIVGQTPGMTGLGAAFCEDGRKTGGRRADDR